MFQVCRLDWGFSSMPLADRLDFGQHPPETFQLS
jgi:hypothetical protein